MCWFWLGLSKAAHVVLCFQFVTTPVLITHWCFSCGRAVLTQCQVFFYFSWCPTSKVPGSAQLAQMGQKDVPYHMASHATIKLRERRRKGGTFGDMAFIFPGAIPDDGLCSPGNGWTSACQWEAVNGFLGCSAGTHSFCLSCLLLQLKLLLELSSQSRSFCTDTFLTCPAGREAVREWLPGADLPVSVNVWLWVPI